MNKKLTIITICFNAEKTISKTIESISSQKTADIEYIIIDGASNDGTLEIIDSHKDDIDIFISESDYGISDAFNKGLAHAKGEYIAFLNADDFYVDGALKQLLSVISDSCSADLIYGKTERLSLDGIISNKLSNKNLNISLPFSHCSSVLKRNYFERYGVFNTSIDIAMDIELFLRGYNDINKFEVDFVIACQRDGGVSDVNRLKGYYQYFLIYSMQNSFLKGLSGYIYKIFVFHLNKLRGGKWF